MGDTSKKTSEQYFSDWEKDAFGYGYGTGEAVIIPELKKFFASVKTDGSYDYMDMEKACGKAVAWLLINRLCQKDILEYGTSPRSGWLTEAGKRLKAFVDEKSADDLFEMTYPDDPNYFSCDPAFCNCAGSDETTLCPNPFWNRP